MTNKPKREPSEFNVLKKLGFELEAPQDGFSYQPDSGGTANGAIGRDEYGIDVDPDAAPRDVERVRGERSTQDLVASASARFESGRLKKR